MRARAWAIGLAVLCAPISARADRDKAAVAYKQATSAFAHGDFTQAANAFETAYAEDPRGASIYNAALSWQGAHDAPRAADDFTRAISASDLRPDLLDNAKVQLAKLEAELGRVAITGPGGTRFAVAHASGVVPSEVHLGPGHYVVHATYTDGTAGDFPVDANAGASGRVDVTRAIVVQAAPPPVPQKRVVGILGPRTLPIAIGVIGAGAIAAGFSIGLGIATLDALDAYKQTNYTSQSAHDHATELRDWTNVTLVIALAVGGAGIAALFTIHHVDVQAGIGPGAAFLRGTF